jgi:hypothetical protein
MAEKGLIALLYVVLLLVGCKANNAKTGNVIRIDYEDVEVKNGEWVKIDSFKFEHVGRLEHVERWGSAKKLEFPIPSSEVVVRNQTLTRKRDYNSRVFPLHIAKHLQRVNKKLPKNKEFLVTSRFLLMYKGTLEIVKRDSSKIKISTSKGYKATVKVTDKTK